MEKFNTVPVVRHLDDIDDLKEFGRDGILMPNQELEACKYGEGLVDILHTEGKKALLLLCSTQKRGVQTGELISEEVRKKDSKIKTLIVEKQALANMYEGVFNLPDDYQAGDKFEGLVLGKKVFTKEVFGDDPNIQCRFGDPVDLGDGSYKYPELVGYFKEYGESHKDFMLRLLQLITETAQSIERLHKNTKVIAITHSLQYQMFYDIQKISEDVIKDQAKFDPGKLYLLCWEKYRQRMLQGAPLYDVRNIDIDNLYDARIIEIFEREIDYLNNLTQ